MTTSGKARSLLRLVIISFKTILVVILASLIYVLFQLVAPKLSPLAWWLMGAALPIIIYQFDNSLGWLIVFLVVIVLVFSSILAGYLHSQVCRIVIGLDWIGNHCSQGYISSTYFGSICYPVLPAVGLGLWISAKSKETLHDLK